MTCIILSGKNTRFAKLFKQHLETPQTGKLNNYLLLGTKRTKGTLLKGGILGTSDT